MRSLAVTTAVALTLSALSALGQTPGQKQNIDKALPTIRKMAADPVVVKAIKAQNAKKLSMEWIKKMDAEWMATTGISDKIKAYLDNPSSVALRSYKAALPAMVECFSMDDQGGLVGTIGKTTDYWQGDEAKWQKSFAQGKGAVFIDKPEFDDSSQTYSVQISVPVMDGGKAIGALTVGLSLDKI